MISSATAKVLFFHRPVVRSQGCHGIFATSNSDNYSWCCQGENWYLKTKGLPTDGWACKGEQPPPKREGGMTVISYHHRGADSSLDLASGNRVLKEGDTVFYIVDPGAPNEKVFTILYTVK